MNSATCIVADDEPLLRERLRELLSIAWPDLRVLDEAEDGAQALRALQLHSPDIAFLDIRMPGMTGLEIAQAYQGRAHLVFVTAFDEHAIAAFEAGVVDYVLKPVELPRLVKVIERLKSRIGSAPTDVAAVLRALEEEKRKAPKLQWIQASQGNQTRFIPVEDILYIQSDAKYSKVVTREHESLIRTPIKDLVEQLDGERFWQTHRGTIVNVKYLAGVVRDGDGGMEVMVKERKERLPVSQSFHRRFRQM